MWAVWGWWGGVGNAADGARAGARLRPCHHHAAQPWVSHPPGCCSNFPTMPTRGTNEGRLWRGSEYCSVLQRWSLLVTPGDSGGGWTQGVLLWTTGLGPF